MALPLLSIEDSKRLVDQYLVSLIEERTGAAAKLHPRYQMLWQSIGTLVDAGGKRLRPYLAFLTYQAYGGNDVEKVIPAAISLEFVHLSMLAHDDIIDRDIIRYGVPNVSGQYLEDYAPLLKNETDRRHFSDSAALLAGDLLISEAHSQLLKTEIDHKLLVRAHDCLDEAFFRVIGGELLDTEASFQPEEVIDPTIVMTEKTASYSFVAPLTMGAVLAEADEAEVERLRQLGTTVGIAYQLRDDLLGVFGDSSKTGKSTDGDLKEGKRTMLVKEFFVGANENQKQAFSSYFGNHSLSPDEAEKARHLLIESGAKQAIEERINRHIAEGEQLIDQLAIDHPYKQALLHLLTSALQRDR